MLLIGSDPELLLVKEDDLRYCNVNTVLSVAHNFIGSSRRIGQDHCGRVFEIRPGTGTPEEHMEQIRGCLRDIGRFIPPGWMLVGGGGAIGSDVIGGHIHISGDINDNMLGERENICRYMDNMIGIPLVLVENRMMGIRRRNSSSYGHLAGVSTSRMFKGDGHVEYRALSSWLTHPTMTKAALAMMWVATDQYLREKSVLRRILAISSSGDEIKEAFRTIDTDVLMPTVNTAKEVFQTCHLWSRYESWINPIFDMIENKKTFYKLSILKNWDLERGPAKVTVSGGFKKSAIEKLIKASRRLVVTEKININKTDADNHVSYDTKHNDFSPNHPHRPEEEFITTINAPSYKQLIKIIKDNLPNISKMQVKESNTQGEW